MALNEKKNRRKALISTLVVHLGLLILFLFVGLTYYDPKPEDGILINFGNSETGLGQEYQTPTNSSPQPQQSQTEVQESDVLTQDVEDAPTIQAQEDPKPIEKKKEQKPNDSQTEKPETRPEEIKDPEPQPSDELQKMLDLTKNSKSGGEGISESGGDQGREDGDPNSNSYSGNGGGGSGDGNYLLGNRQALQKPKPNYPCTEEGRVVVKIYVDKNGKVVRAVAGERVPGGSASTTTSTCLYEQARRAAMKTTWQPDRDAADQQSGYIIYNFKKRWAATRKPLIGYFSNCRCFSASERLPTKRI